MSVAGIDLGVHVIHIGVVSDLGEVVNAAHLKIDKAHDPVDLAELFDRLVKYLSANGVTKITVERPLVFLGAGYPVLHMSEMFCLAKLAAARINATVTAVTPAQWRKNVLDHGGASKAMAIKHVKEEMNWTPSSHDEAESICIALYDTINHG